jgi:hypothetical protein
VQDFNVFTMSNPLENYVNWKFKLMTVLEAYNLWSIVKVMKSKPTATSIPDWDKLRNES